MPLPFELTAENVVKYAKDNGITLEREATSYEFPRLCARSLLTHAATGHKSERGGKLSMYDWEASQKVGISEKDMQNLEFGFEDFDLANTNIDANNDYYRLGQEIFRLSQSEAS